jgi:hypothetical protein
MVGQANIVSELAGARQQRRVFHPLDRFAKKTSGHAATSRASLSNGAAFNAALIMPL